MSEQKPLTLERAHERVFAVKRECQKFLFGIDQAIDNMLIGMFSLVPYDGDGKKELGQGHVLLMAPPGLGKTGMMRTMSAAVNASCSLVVGYAEMKIGEIFGGEIYNPLLNSFTFVRGPIFTNIFLFDEINRAHPKSQALFLQAMEERFVSVNITNLEKKESENRLFPLFPISNVPDERRKLFWVVATANPIEQEGTYPIPEAQLDRFSFSFGIDFPPREEEKKIRLENVYSPEDNPALRVNQVMNLAEALEVANFIVNNVRFSEEASEYIMRLIENSRPLSKSVFGRLAKRSSRDFASPSFSAHLDKYVLQGLSPRSNFHFQAGARTIAFLHGRNYVSLDDVKEAARLVMPHRLILEPKARAKRISTGIMVEEILENTFLPT